jgi:hypothetical protein
MNWMRRILSSIRRSEIICLACAMFKRNNSMVNPAHDGWANLPAFKTRAKNGLM